MGSSFDINEYDFNQGDEASLIALAEAAKRAGRFEDMAQVMKKLVEVVVPSNELSDEQRRLLSVAFKNVVAQRRAAWRLVSSLEHQQPTHDLEIYRIQIEQELSDICHEAIGLLEDTLLAHLPTQTYAVDSNGDVVTETNEAWVFFRKMIGDYYRYFAEFDKNPVHGDKANEHYHQAWIVAQKGLKVTNPTRLGLALNFAVLQFEVFNDADSACQTAKRAFDDAMAQLDDIEAQSDKNSSVILQQLKDNLTFWRLNH